MPDSSDQSSFPSRKVEQRQARPDVVAPRRGRMLRLTHHQRDLLRQGLADLAPAFEDAELWHRAADEARQAEDELDLPGLGVAVSMWVSNVAALTHGAWWLLMPGCAAPALQDDVCKTLERPFFERRPEFAPVVEALTQVRFAHLAQLLDRAERVRCVLAMHVREHDQSPRSASARYEVLREFATPAPEPFDEADDAGDSKPPTYDRP